MAGKLVSYRYTDGRTKPPPEYVVTIGYLRVQEMLDAGAPIEVVEGAEFVKIAEKAKEGEEKKAPPKKEEGDRWDGDHWPEGYTYTKAKGWYTVTSPDGEPVKGPSKKGAFRGEKAAQEGAWKHQGVQG